MTRTLAPTAQDPRVACAVMVAVIGFSIVGVGGIPVGWVDLSRPQSQQPSPPFSSHLAISISITDGLSGPNRNVAQGLVSWALGHAGCPDVQPVKRSAKHCRETLRQASQVPARHAANVHASQRIGGAKAPTAAPPGAVGTRGVRMARRCYWGGELRPARWMEVPGT